MTSDKNGNRPDKLSLVEMEAALNAGHAVESASEMQPFCAIVMGILPASSVQSVVVRFRRVCGRRPRCRRRGASDVVCASVSTSASHTVLSGAM